MHDAAPAAPSSLPTPRGHAPERTSPTRSNPPGLSGDRFLVGGVRIDVEIESNLEGLLLSDPVSPDDRTVGARLFADQSHDMTSLHEQDSHRLIVDHDGGRGHRPRTVDWSPCRDDIEFELADLNGTNDEDEPHVSSPALDVRGPDESIAGWGATKAVVSEDESRPTVNRSDSGH